MVILDTYFDVDWDRCIKCYKCIHYCSDDCNSNGVLSLIAPDPDTGLPYYIYDNNCRCHHCTIEINGQTKSCACNYVCEQGAINIMRW